MSKPVTLSLSKTRGRKTCTVKLWLDPAGVDVVAASTSINYDQNKLDYVGVKPGPDIKESESEALNTNDKDAGLIGVGFLVDGIAKLIAAGKKAVIAEFKFKVKAGAPTGLSPVFFDDTPTRRSVAILGGKLVQDPKWIDGGVTTY